MHASNSALHESREGMHVNEKDKTSRGNPISAPTGEGGHKCKHARNKGGGLRGAVLGEHHTHQGDHHDANDDFDLELYDGAAP